MSLWWTVDSPSLNCGCTNCQTTVLANLQINLILDVVCFGVFGGFFLPSSSLKQNHFYLNLLHTCVKHASVWPKSDRCLTTWGILPVFVELVNFGCHRWYCAMGVKSNQLPLNVSLQGKNQGTARRCLPVDQSSKNPTRARVALLLGHCRSLHLFPDTALREERNWKGPAASSVTQCWRLRLNRKQLARALCLLLEMLPVPRSDSFFWGLARDGTSGGQFCWHGKYQTAIRSRTSDVNWGWVCSALQNPCA